MAKKNSPGDGNGKDKGVKNRREEGRIEAPGIGALMSALTASLKSADNS
ncbi:hypothetical protein [Nocardia abscessus]|nr:hypothetical protein [Nocardia abscessus]